MSVDTEIFIPPLQFILVFIFITIGTIYVLRYQTNLILPNPPQHVNEDDSSDEEDAEESTPHENSPPPENNLSSSSPQPQEIPNLPPPYFPRTITTYRPSLFLRRSAMSQFVQKARRYARSDIEHPLPLAKITIEGNNWYLARTLIQHITDVLVCDSCPVHLAQTNLFRRDYLLFHIMAAIILDFNTIAAHQFQILIKDIQTFDSIRQRLIHSNKDLFLSLSQLIIDRNTEYLRYASPTNISLRKMLNRWNRPFRSTDV